MLEFDWDRVALHIDQVVEELRGEQTPELLDWLANQLDQAAPYTAVTIADLLLRLTFHTFNPPAPPDKVTLNQLNSVQIEVLKVLVDASAVWVFPVRAIEILRVYRLPGQRAALREFLSHP